MNKLIRIDGQDFEVSEQVAKAYAAKKDAYKSDIEKLEGKVEKHKARADAAEAELKKAQEALAIANDPARLREKISSRVALETQARTVLGSDAKLDKMSEREVKVAVISKLDKDFRADSRSDEYVSARYDIAIETSDKTDSLSLVRQQEHGDGDDKSQRVDAREKWMKESREMWKRPLTAVAPGFKA